RGAQIVEWASRSIALTGPDEAMRVEAEALLGLGLACQGRSAEGVAEHQAALNRAAAQGSTAPLVRIARGAVRLAIDDLVPARAELSEAALVGEHATTIFAAVWAYVWLSQAEFSLGAWDEAAVAAER